jgi:hypothetical protein
LPLLPVEFRESSAGIYPAVVRYDLTASDTRAHVDATPGAGNATRDGAVRLTSGEVVNEISIEYQPEGETSSRYRERRVLTGQWARPSLQWIRSESPDERVLGLPLLAASQARYGVRPRALRANAVWDDATAIAVARHHAYRYAWPRRSVRYAVDAGLERLEIGDGVLVTDPELYLSSAVAVVVDLVAGADSVTLDLVILDRPEGA